MNNLLDFLIQNSIDFFENISLKDFGTFKIGGNARLVCMPNSTTQVSEIIKYCYENSVDYITIGRGSNVVFSDDGVKSLLIKTDKIDLIEKSDDVFTFGAGVMLARASRYSVDCGYKGMEFAYGIPGSVGGALFMNAGAYGGEMSQIVCYAEYVDDRGNICVIDKKSLDFGYRHTFFSDKKYIVTSVSFKLSKGNKADSEKLIKEFQDARKSKQPLEYPSAGSVFKRPEGHFAGKLIQDSSLGGYTIGGAQVSTKHCGFIINVGDATCSDVKKLIAHIQKTVKQNYNIDLECEIRFIGD